MPFMEGARVRATANFSNEAGAAIDPTTVTARIRNPSREVTVYTYGVGSEIEKIATGVYQVLVDLDEPGNWVIRIESDGVGKAAVESTVKVWDSDIV